MALRGARLRKGEVPAHVALIMDGNGRWANSRGLARTEGHRAGEYALMDTIAGAIDAGVRYLSVYTFSTENWKRPEAEVGALMQLFRFYAKRLLKIAKEHDVRVKMIGERNRFAPDLIAAINSLEEETKDAKGMTFIIAVNYAAGTKSQGPSGA